MLNTLYSLEAPLDILRKFDQIWGGGWPHPFQVVLSVSPFLDVYQHAKNKINNTLI